MENKERKILSDEELALVTGGTGSTVQPRCTNKRTKAECEKDSICSWSENTMKCYIKPIQIER